MMTDENIQKESLAEELDRHLRQKPKPSTYKPRPSPPEELPPSFYFIFGSFVVGVIVWMVFFGSPLGYCFRHDWFDTIIFGVLGGIIGVIFGEIAGFVLYRTYNEFSYALIGAIVGALIAAVVPLICFTPFLLLGNC